MTKPKRFRTPAAVMVDILKGAMLLRSETQVGLSKKTHVHINTVNRDFNDPERIPQDRLWLYFTALDIPIDGALEAFGKKYLEELIKR